MRKQVQKLFLMPLSFDKVYEPAGRLKWSFLKAIVLAFAWVALPFWGFLALALYFYFFPWFRPVWLFWPLATLMFLSWVMPYAFWSTIFIGVIFFIIIGIKDLAFIDRERSYEVLALLLFFGILIEGFSRFPNWDSVASWGWFLGVAVLFFFLSRGFLAHGHQDDHLVSIESRRRMAISLSLVSFLVWQGAIVMAFLPIHFLSQASFLFLATTIFIAIVVDQSHDRLTRGRILWYFSGWLALNVIALSATQWSL